MDLRLRNSVEKFLKQKVADVLVDVKFHPIEGKEICEVIVIRSSKPIVLCDGDKEEFMYVVANLQRYIQHQL